MIIPDLNLLIYAYNADANEHAAAQQWWADLLTGPEEIGLAWIVILGFVRITTRRGLAARPLPVSTVIDLVRAWLAAPTVRILMPGNDHAPILFDLLEHVGTAGNLTTDAHLAALAIEYRARIASSDYDFARFPKVRWFNPISGN
jgi:toxin-antitoxin system PIN domain toxin